MTVLRWESAMQLGVPAIDADHKRLVGLLNQLHYAVIAGEDEEGIGRLLEDLVGYTQTHFAREEDLMERGGYPELQHHRQIHERLADRMQAFRDSFLQSPDDFDMHRFYDFVSGWLLHHVLGEDMKLKPYVERAVNVACA